MSLEIITGNMFSG